MSDTNNKGGSRHRKKVLDTIENYAKLTSEEKNCLHVYYGYGKGKTTSAVGLAIRALGAGKKVAIVQFDKGYDGSNEHYSERTVIRKLKEIGYEIDLYPTGCERMNADGTFRFNNAEDDFAEARRGLDIAGALIKEGNQDLLILDESIAAAAYNLITKSDVNELIALFKKNRRFEMVMTGHKIWKEIEESADLITEMRKVKHYFDNGIPAREGIEY